MGVVSRVVALTVFLAGALALPAAATAATRYARAVGGATSGPCTTAPPAGCELQYAIDVAAPADVVEVGPGAYQRTGGYFVGKAVTLRGTPGSRPALSTPADEDDDTVLFVSGAATVDNLAVDAPALDVAVGLSGGATMTNSIVTSSADEPALVSDRGSQVLRNSIVWNRATDDAIEEDVDTISDNSSVTGALALRNVTAVATGPDDHAVSAIATKFCSNCSSHASIDAVNVIARSPGSELRTVAATGSTATITATFSNFRTVDGAVSGPTGNQGSPPAFANAGAGDFHQLAGSTTIDSGSDNGDLGASDIDGQARVNGLAPDIGADEYYAPPPPSPGALAAAGAAPKDTTKPRVTALTLSPAAFVAADKGPSASAATTGTTVRFRLSEAARLRFTVERRGVGRRVGRKCVKSRRSNRTAKRCTRYTTLRGSFSRPGKAGVNSFHFTGRLRGAKLRTGRYRLVGSATDPAGNHGTRFRAAFRIKKP